MFSKSEIMTAAWAAFRSLSAADLEKMGQHRRRIRFNNCLRTAWEKAKRLAMPAPVKSAAARIRETLAVLENKSRLRSADFNHIAALQAELRAIAS